MEFVNSAKVKTKLFCNFTKIDKIIKTFNNMILGERDIDDSSDGTFSLNTGIKLNETEFELLQKKANKTGWNIEMVDGEYCTKTYILKIK